MKRFLSLFIMLLFCAGFVAAQTEVSKPIVVKATYFDVSPPLRDMVKKMPAKVDMTWKDGVVKNNVYRKEKHEGDDLDIYDPNVQTWFGKSFADTTIQNFEGLGNTAGVCPPDPDGDVSPNHYFLVTNLSYAIYNKSGVKIFGPAFNSSIFSGMPNNSNDGDGIVLYDEEADRWLFSQFSLPNDYAGPFFEMIAISQTSDPTGSWYRYQYQFSDMPDYPKLAVWPDGYYMSVNRFGASTLNYKGTGVAAFNRDKMLAGDLSAEMVYFTTSASAEPYCFLPSDCDGEFPPTGTPNYFTYLNDSPDRLGIYEFHVDWTNTSLSTFTQSLYLPVTSFNGNLSGISQKGTTTKLDPLTLRLMFRLQFRKFTDHWSMVSNAHINMGSNVAGIRWYELRKSGSDAWSIYQEGTYSPDNNSRWMGSIAMDEAGNMALGFSISSSSMYPSIRYTGRMEGDALGEMTIEESGIINGGGSQTNTWSGDPSRWGDYSAMVADPSEASKFWYIHEYYSTTSDMSWKTRVGSFSFANILTVLTTASPDTLCEGSGGSTQLMADATGGSGTYTYSWTSNPPGFTSGIQNPIATPTESTWYICDVNDGAETKTDSVLVSVVPPPSAFAGNDTTYCWYVPAFPLMGVVGNYNYLKWTTAGDGHFNIDTVAYTLYFVGSGDRANGYASLTLTAYSTGICADSTADNIIITLDPCTGIPEPAFVPLGVTVQPNPASNDLHLTVVGLKDSQARLTITDIQGRTVFSDGLKTNGNKLTRFIDVSNFSRGVYIVKVQSEKEIASERLVIQ